MYLWPCTYNYQENALLLLFSHITDLTNQHRVCYLFICLWDRWKYVLHNINWFFEVMDQKTHTTTERVIDNGYYITCVIFFVCTWVNEWKSVKITHNNRKTTWSFRKTVNICKWILFCGTVSKWEKYTNRIQFNWFYMMTRCFSCIPRNIY